MPFLLFTWAPHVRKCPIGPLPNGAGSAGIIGLHGFFIKCQTVTSHNPADWAHHYWPVVLFVVGLVAWLAGRRRGRRQSEPPALAPN